MLMEIGRPKCIVLGRWYLSLRFQVEKQIRFTHITRYCWDSDTIDQQYVLKCVSFLIAFGIRKNCLRMEKESVVIPVNKKRMMKQTSNYQGVWLLSNTCIIFPKLNPYVDEIIEIISVNFTLLFIPCILLLSYCLTSFQQYA
jgi:hypothetical protein